MRKLRIVFLLLIFATSAMAQQSGGISFRPPTGIALVGQSEVVLSSVGGLNLPTTGTIEEVLKTVTLPANTLTNYTGFRVECIFQAAANTNAKTVSIRIGGLAGTVVATRAGDTTSGDTYQLGGTFLVTSSTSISAFMSSLQNTGTSNVFGVNVSALTFANTLDVTATAETATAAGDITLVAMRVVLLVKTA